MALIASGRGCDWIALLPERLAVEIPWDAQLANQPNVARIQCLLYWRKASANFAHCKREGSLGEGLQYCRNSGLNVYWPDWQGIVVHW